MINGRDCRGRRTAFWAAALLLAGVAPARAQEPAPELMAYRFWRAPDKTLVEGVASVPWSILSFSRQGEHEQAVYSAVFQVKDQAGNIVLNNEWQDTVVTPPLTPASRSRASSTQTFVFSVPAGTWTLSLQLRDAGSGRPYTAERTLEALRTAPATSDLILAAAIDEVAADAPPPAGALVRGKLAVVPNLAGAITTDRTRLGILAEVYRPAAAQPETAQVVVQIEGTAGSAFRYQTPPQQRVFSGGGVDALALDLAGLPPGDYRLTAVWMIGGDTLRAQHPLRMLPPGSGVIAFAVEGMYEGLTATQLDSVYGPMKYILGPHDEATFETLADADAKRRFLTEYWQRVGQATGRPPAELRKEWDDRVTYANRMFEKPGSSRSKTFGWQSDRGRIYLTYGAPDDRLEDRAKERSNPWEAWKYISGRGTKYVFWDQSGFGDYILVYSTDPNERGLPNWRQLMRGNIAVAKGGLDPVEQVERW